jgi:hypothetical protein
VYLRALGRAGTKLTMPVLEHPAELIQASLAAASVNPPATWSGGNGAGR